MLAKEARGLAARTTRRRALFAQSFARRATLSTASSSSESSSPGPSTPSVSSSLPWFMDPADDGSAIPSPYTRRTAAPQSTVPLAPLPSAIPSDHPIALLHDALKICPHLEPGTLLVREPIATVTGPPLPDAMPKGRRKRGRTYVGEGPGGNLGGPWSWLVIAQVRRLSCVPVLHA